MNCLGSRLRVNIFSAVLCLSATAYGAEGEFDELYPNASEFAKVLKVGWQAAVANPELAKIQKDLISSKHDITAAGLDEPWTTGVNLSQMRASPLPGKEASRSVDGSSMKTSVNYLSDRGYEAQLAHTYSYSSTRNNLDPYNPPDRFDSRSKVNRVEMSVSYDVIMGGDRGVAKIQKSSTILSTRSRIESLFESRRQIVEAIFGELMDLYISQCKAQNADKILVLARDVSETGKAKMNAKIISEKDYLSFLNLENSANRRMINYQNEILVANEALRQRGVTPTDVIPAGQRLSCSPWQHQGLWPKVPDTNLQKKIVSESSNVKSADFLVQSSKARWDMRNLQVKPSVKPFLSSDWQMSPDGFPEETGSTTIGVSLDWTVPAKKSLEERLALEESFHSAQDAMQDAILKRSSAMRSAIARIDVYDSQFQIHQKSLKTALELFELTKGRFEAGFTDPLTLANAQISAIDAYEALLDGWSAKEKANFRLYSWAKSARVN